MRCCAEACRLRVPAFHKHLRFRLSGLFGVRTALGERPRHAPCGALRDKRVAGAVPSMIGIEHAF